MAIFDQEAENYDQWYKTIIGRHADQVETNCAFQLFEVRPGMRILDVGCGTGNFCIKLAHKGALITGIDLSEKMLTIAQKKAEKEKVDIEFIKMDCQNLQFPDNFFEGVISMATVEFIYNPQKMIAEMFRVCKNRGQILIGTINRESDWGRLYQDPEYLKNVPVFKNAYFKSPEDLIKFRKDALITTKECLFIPPDIPELEISEEKEKEFSSKRRGGFFCTLWQKKELLAKK